MENYRAESGAVYIFDKNQNAYIFVGNLNGEKLADWIADYEEGVALGIYE